MKEMVHLSYHLVAAVSVFAVVVVLHSMIVQITIFYGIEQPKQKINLPRDQRNILSESTMVTFVTLMGYTDTSLSSERIFSGKVDFSASE